MREIAGIVCIVECDTARIEIRVNRFAGPAAVFGVNARHIK
jgi:hypothetical protein